MFRHVYIPANVGDRIDGAIPSFASFNEMNITAQAIQANGFESWEAAFNAFDGN